MVRKRKVPIVEEEKENENENGLETLQSSTVSMTDHGPMYTIMSNAQLNENFHKKYVKQMRKLYEEMDHDAFVFAFVKMIKTAMEAEESNDYAHNTLLFCAMFVSSFEGDETHRMLLDTFNWTLTTISSNPHIRFRLCQFVNTILNALGVEAALDDSICDRILEYMLERLRDIAPSVRLQAIQAMQRLQVPDNPDDPVLRVYQFHLCSDPSPRVRQAVITAMGRNYHTIPYILDRLWDIDEKVRRHTYLHMSSYPVRSYKVAQRLTLLEQGLNDRSEGVRKVVTSVMLQQWIESYQKNLISLIAALKLDSTEEELNRFQKITKQTLHEIFQRQSIEDLIGCVPLEEDSEFHRCIPHAKLTIETAIYWQCLTEFLIAKMAEEVELIMPELSEFCAYVERFCDSQSPEMDKFELMEFQCKLLSLVEILYTFDLCDETGRGNLQKLLTHLMKNSMLDEKIIKVVVQCAENLMKDQSTRLQFFVDIINDICDFKSKKNDLVHDRALVEELLAKSNDADLKFNLSSLKVKILDLEEQQTNHENDENYEKAQEINEQRVVCTEEFIALLKPLLELNSMSYLGGQLPKVVKAESILKSLQIAWYMVVTPHMKSLNLSICQLYKDFICRHIASTQILIRDWALRCGTAYSMLYEPLAKGVFTELCSQFFRNNNIRLWETSIKCIFELLERYGLDKFVVEANPDKVKRPPVRQLYSTLDIFDMEEDGNISMGGQEVRIIYMMSHLMDQCQEVCLIKAIVIGFCRLVLRGIIQTTDILEKLLLRYFNPSSDAGINQILGVFLENLIERKRHKLLEPCLLPTITTVLNAPYDSPLHDIRPETITRFVIDATRQEPCAGIDTLHNKLAKSFLLEMLNNVGSKEMCKLLAKELTTLQLSLDHDEKLKNEMKSMSATLIKVDREFDHRTIKNIVNFRKMLDGNFKPTNQTGVNETDEDAKSDDETVSSVSKCNMQPDDAITTNDSETVSSEAETISAAPSETLVQQVAVANAEGEVSANVTLTPALRLGEPCEALDTSETAGPSSRSAAGTPQVGDAELSTTFGRNNIVGHSYLRKSLNLSRGLSDSESDGPTRPPKIRIEARIDSDKKDGKGETVAQPQTPLKSPPVVKNTRARKNLRNALQGVANEQSNAVASAENPAQSRAASQRKAAATANKALAEKRQTRRRKETETAATSTAASTATAAADEEEDNDDGSDEETSQTPSQVSIQMPVRSAAQLSSPQKSTTPMTRATRRTASVIEETPDAIPPSPPAESPRILSVRKARGRGLAQPTKSVQSTATVDEQPSMTSPRPAAPTRAQMVLTMTTPLRNGRKRVLRKSSDGSVAPSPQRKQRRSEPVRSPRPSTSKAARMRRSSLSSTSSSGVITGMQFRRSSAAPTGRSGGDGMLRRSLRREKATNVEPLAIASPSSRSGVKRKRKILDQVMSAFNIPMNAYPGGSPKKKAKQPSRIPICNISRLYLAGVNADRIIRNSSSSSTSLSSSSEDTGARPSQRSLTVKMTRIDLRVPRNVEGPVSMSQAQPVPAVSPRRRRQKRVGSPRRPQPTPQISKRITRSRK